MSDSKSKIYADSILNAREIAIELGEKEIATVNYNKNYTIEVCSAYNYEYEDLSIKYHTGKVGQEYVSVVIGGNRVLYYNFTKQKADYVEGKWIDLITIIYGQINDILEKRAIKTKKRNKIISELKKYEDYFKYFIECNEDNKEIFSVINRVLYDKDIVIDKKVTIYNKYDDKYSCPVKSSHYTWQMYYDNEKVLNFSNNPSNVFPNTDYYADAYVPGKWMNIFKEVITDAKATEEKLFPKQANDDSENIIKAFTKIK